MNITDQDVQAYVDGELAPEERARIERAIADDVLVAARVEREQRLRAQVRRAFDPVLDEPVPDRLRGLLERSNARDGHVVGARVDADVVHLDARRTARPSRWRTPVVALAASVAALAIAAWLRTPGGDVAVRDGALVARGELAHALDDALASAPDARAPVTIGLTFRDAGGRVCRTFDVAARGLAGLACRDRTAWAVPVLVRTDVAPEGEVRQAGGGMPAEVQAAIDARMQGDAFDASQERAAQGAGWR